MVKQKHVERIVFELKKCLEEQNITLLNQRLNDALTVAALQTGGAPLQTGGAPLQTGGALLCELKCGLFESGLLSEFVFLLKQSRLEAEEATALAQLLSSCCVGAEPADQTEAFHRLFLPSVINALLSLAVRLVQQNKSLDLLKTVLDSVSWILQTHTALTTHVLSSVLYEKLQMFEEESVSLLCLSLWINICDRRRDFLTLLSNESLSLLLNDAVGQLAVSTEAQVGGASVRLMLLLAGQVKARLPPLLREFRGLDSLLDKDWRGRGFEQELDQLIRIIQSRETLDDTEHARAACIIQSAWRSHQTRKRVKNLHRAVTSLQRKYRSRRQQQLKQQEAQQWEESLRHQVILRRQQARRQFHLKQRKLLQLLPPEQVRSFLEETEFAAAVLIQRVWKGFRDRTNYRRLRERKNDKRQETRAATVLQRAVRRFLIGRRAAKIPPSWLWIGQKGLTDRRRAELKKQVEDYITLHPSSLLSPPQSSLLHSQTQMLIQSQNDRVMERRRREQKIQTLLALTSTQLSTIRDSPSLSSVSPSVAHSFFSCSSVVAARARDSHNALLQTGRAPWWRILGNEVQSSDHAPLEELEAELRRAL